MQLKDLKKYKIPSGPGVYFFLDRNKKPIYIGKATTLSLRVKSYFSVGIIESRGPLILDMVFKAHSLKWQEVESVFEALILEANLIKKHQPKYNTKEKDQKSFNYLVFTDEKFPRVLIARGRELGATDFKIYQGEKIKKFYGPFPKGQILKEALMIVRKIFPFRDKCKIASKKPCFNYQIGLCPGVCVGKISEKDYQKQVRNIQMIFDGKIKNLVKKLESEMKAYSKKMEFEKAGEIKKKIFALKHIQDISLIKKESSFEKNNVDFRIESYDVAHISGEGVVGVMTVWENGEVNKNEYRKFKIKTSTQNDLKSLEELLTRRLGHLEWKFPNLIVVDGGNNQREVGEKVVKNKGLNISVVSVVKDERHKPKGILGPKELTSKYQKEIILVNSEAHRFAIGYHRNLMRKRL